MIIRGLGHSTTETLVGTPWKAFLEVLYDFSSLVIYFWFCFAGGRGIPQEIQKVSSQPSNCLGKGHYRNGLPIGGVAGGHRC
jgi:hypothetical protein